MENNHRSASTLMDTPASSLVNDPEQALSQSFLKQPAGQRHHLEQLMAGRMGADTALAIISPEAALVQILEWIGVGKGDEVILSAYNPPWLANAAVRMGAKPVFADTLKDSPHLDPEAVRRAISERTKIVIGTNILGETCDFDALLAVVNNARVKGVYIPKTISQQRLERILVVSFFADGIISEANYHRVAPGSDINLTSLAWNGVYSHPDGAVIGFHLPLEFRPEHVYNHFCTAASDGIICPNFPLEQQDMVQPGYQALMTGSQVASTLEKTARFVNVIAPFRFELLEKYRFVFKKLERVIVPDFVADTVSVFQFSITKCTPEQVRQLVEELNRRNVPVRALYKPLPLLTWYNDNGYSIRDFPNALQHYSNTVVLPVSPDVTPAMIVEYADLLATKLH